MAEKTVCDDDILRSKNAGKVGIIRIAGEPGETFVSIVGAMKRSFRSC